MKQVHRHDRYHRQQGAALVEFALVASMGFVVLLLAVFELGRLLFIFNTASEATRLGARLAVVCDANATLITQRMSVLLPQLNAATVDIQYEPSGCAADPVSARASCQSVTVAVKPGTTVNTFIPLPNFSADIPAFTTTLTREAMDSSSCT
ncbi:MAG: TadE/TadG family type IV pilus assembly protein [Burkholderiaceae bacterium]